MTHTPACRCSFCRQYVSGFIDFATSFPIFADPTMPLGRIDFRQDGRTVASIINVAHLEMPTRGCIITSIEPEPRLDDPFLIAARNAWDSADLGE